MMNPKFRIKTCFSILLFLALLPGFPSARGETVNEQPVDRQPAEDDEFVTGRELFWSGRYEQAEKFFLSYLTKNPDHQPTKVFLQMIHEARHFDPEKEKFVRKALEEVRFKRIEWKEMPLDKVIAFLREETQKQIPQGEKVNFINLIPESAEIGKITISAEDANLAQLIEKISRQAGVHHRIESEGIVFETKARSI